MKVPPISTPTRMAHVDEELPLLCLRLWHRLAPAPSTEDIEQPHNLQGYRLAMNARQLEIFHAVMRSGTIAGCGGAAFGISQPAVSKAVRAIERSLGFRLLRPIKGPPLSDAGGATPAARRRPHRRAGCRPFERLTGEVKTGGAALVRVVASSSSATALLPAAAAALQKADPAVRALPRALLAGPRRRRSRCRRRGGFRPDARRLVQLPGLTVRPLGAAEMVFIAPLGHPLLEREAITHCRSRAAPADLVRPRDAFRPAARPGVRECRRAPADRPPRSP